VCCDETTESVISNTGSYDNRLLRSETTLVSTDGIIIIQEGIICSLKIPEKQVSIYTILKERTKHMYTMVIWSV
jgi:hypothetical protein